MRPSGQRVCGSSFLAKPFAVEVDLPIDQLEVARGLLELGQDGLSVSLEERQALPVGVVSRLEQLRVTPDLPDRHPGGAQLGQELDALQVLLGVAAVAAAVPADRLEQ